LECEVGMNKHCLKLSIYTKTAVCDAVFGVFIGLGNWRVIFLMLGCYGRVGGIVMDVSIWVIQSLIIHTCNDFVHNAWWDAVKHYGEKGLLIE
jgi:hypothetical protein